MQDSEQRDPLDLLAEDFTESLRRGEDSDIESWAERHPEQAEGIRDLFPTILAMETAKEQSRASAPAASLPGNVDRLGDFRIVGEIGRGGMGVVYEAEQEALGRRVALKVLPPMRNPRRQQRFEREARTAAQLHHTNIVPIYGIGEAEGWNYYVMPVIRGVGLDDAIAAMRCDIEPGHEPEPLPHAKLTASEAARALRTHFFRPAGGDPESGDQLQAELPPDPGPDLSGRSPYWRSVAELGRQVSSALEHAHHHGVLHRDIKPANLLLDQEGVVWVADFGLAKAIEPDIDITHSGDLVGTLQYMAPEQLQGDYDARTDVHALGLTLYELLAWRPAYPSSDRGTLIQRVAESAPPRPSSIRAGIPRDLETIVLKAVQREPSHRYQSAAALREDLEAFLEDRPIKARRITVIEHAFRWGRRNKLVSGLAGVTLAAILIAAVTGWTSWATTRQALNREAAAAEQAREAGERAEDNLALAIQAFEDLFDSLAGPDRLELFLDDLGSGDDSVWAEITPHQVSEEDAALLERMLAFYDRFAERNAGNAELQQDVAKAYRQVGDLQLQLRRFEDARLAYQRALSIFVALNGDDDEHQVAIASIRNDLGHALREQGEREQAMSEHRQSIAILSPLSDSTAARFELARSHELSALLHSWQPRPPGDDSPGDAPPGGSPPADDRPDPRSSRRAWLTGHRKAVEHLKIAGKLLHDLADQEPTNTAIQLAYARNSLNLAFSGFALRRPVEGAAEAVTDSAERLETLLESRPELQALRVELIKLYLTPTLREDEVSVERAIELGEMLLLGEPEAEDSKRLLAHALTARGEQHLSEGDESLGDDDLRRAILLFDELETPHGFDLGARAYAQLAHFAVLEAEGPTAETLAARRTAISELEALITDEASFRGTGRILRLHYRALATALEDSGDEQAAAEAKNKARQFRR